MLTDIELFECFNVEIPGAGDLWEVKHLKAKKTSMKIEKKAGEAGTPERVAKYREMIERGETLFDDKE